LNKKNIDINEPVKIWKELAELKVKQSIKEDDLKTFLHWNKEIDYCKKIIDNNGLKK